MQADTRSNSSRARRSRRPLMPGSATSSGPATGAEWQSPRSIPPQCIPLRSITEGRGRRPGTGISEAPRDGPLPPRPGAPRVPPRSGRESGRALPRTLPPHGGPCSDTSPPRVPDPGLQQRSAELAGSRAVSEETPANLPPGHGALLGREVLQRFQAITNHLPLPIREGNLPWRETVPEFDDELEAFRRGKIERPFPDFGPGQHRPRAYPRPGASTRIHPDHSSQGASIGTRHSRRCRGALSGRPGFVFGPQCVMLTS